MLGLNNTVIKNAKNAIMIAEVYATSDTGKHGENIDRAIEALEDAYRLLDESTHKQVWIELVTKLGIFYLKRCNGERSENGEKAVHYFDLVEKYYGNDFRWGKLQESKGRAYLMQGTGYVDKAISLFQSALPVISKEKLPSYWVYLHINIAKAYSLIEGLANRKKAHEHIAEAKRTLREHKVSEARYYQACIDKIAGDIHIKGMGRQNLLLAIARYEKAIAIFPRDVFPLEHDEVMEALNKAKGPVNQIV